MTHDLLISHPAFLFIAAACIMPVFKKMRLMPLVLIAVPVMAMYQLYHLPLEGIPGTLDYLGFTLVFERVDKLTYLFLHVFILMAFIGSFYSLHVKESGQHSAAYLCVAGSLGVTLAGDYLTLFIFWEMMAFASTFLVWYRKKQKSIDAGFRYLLIHITGGLILLAGIFLKYRVTGDLFFEQIFSEHAGIADYLIMAGFMLNAAVPPFHAWLPDAYPEATVTGAVFMCSYMTTTAVYALARAFSGFEVLVIIGAVTALYGAGYAVVENDTRRILAYHIISQVGYMVCGIGIGTPGAINGAVAYAYAYVIYMALLFMGTGAVLKMTGKSKLSDLGGLFKEMPRSLLFTIIGGLAVSGFPLTSGFISKSMIMAAAGENHHTIILMMLTLASVSTFLILGIKLPYFIWFGKDRGMGVNDPGFNMKLAMFMAAFLCIFLGVKPGYEYLYHLLPYPVDFYPYTSYHFSGTLQILGFTGFGFYLMRKKLNPVDKTSLDVDWFYRKGSHVFIWLAEKPVHSLNDRISSIYKKWGLKFTMILARGISRFDREGIDYTIDGSARSVVQGGNYLRSLQLGKVQHYIGGAVIIMFAVLIVFVLMYEF